MIVSSIFNLGFIKNKFKIGKQYVKKGTRNGFFHILGGNTLVKIISALSVMLFPRIMGEDYGTFKYVESLFGYLLIANGLGMSNVILRYCSAFDTPVEQKSYFTFAVRTGLIADVGILAAFSAILYIPGIFGIQMVQYDAESILTMMMFIVFFDFLFNATQNFLRTNRENKKYASSSVIFSALYALIPFVLAFALGVFHHSMEGAVIGRYIAYAVTLVLIFRTVRTLPAFKEKALRLRRHEKIGIIKYSLNSLVANAFSMIMPYNESIILSIMVTKSLYSDFQVAQLLPASIQFIASSVMVFVYPYFAKNYLDGKWIYQNTKKIILSMAALMSVISFIGIVFAPQIVLIFGSRFKTENAVRLMRVFFITFAVNSAFKMPVGNILAAIGEVRFNVANAIFSCTVHIGICWAMTYTFGIGGAAYGLLIGYVISSAAGIIYLRYYCKKLEHRKNNATVPQADENIEADEKELR
jgi:O-antigen/teichoic acid export membrane protein